MTPEERAALDDRLNSAIALSRDVSQHMKVSPSGLQMIMALCKATGPMRVGELASIVGVTQQGAGKTLRELQNGLLIVIGVDREDKRAKSISITSTGVKLLIATHEYMGELV